jgi:hypothetical protein
MALAEGTSQIHVGDDLSLHAQSLLYIINKFIPNLQYNHENGILSITGIGHQFL